MSVTHQDFEDFASKLTSSADEIDWRMSAARAYYASYHRAKLSIKFCPDNSHLAMGSHEKVSDAFKLHGSPAARSIAYVLMTMKKNRVLADYELGDPFDQSLAVNQLAQHRALTGKLDLFDQISSQKTA